MEKKPIEKEELIDCANHLAAKLTGHNITQVSVENSNVLALQFDTGHKLYIGGATEIAIAKGKITNVIDEGGAKQ